MLSQDLTNLARLSFLAMGEADLGTLQRTMLLVAERIQDAAEKAAHLEAAKIGASARPVVIDLSDPKIELFPRAKRSVPASPTNGDVA
jgi:hypothetical protein